MQLFKKKKKRMKVGVRFKMQEVTWKRADFDETMGLMQQYFLVLVGSYECAISDSTNQNVLTLGNCINNLNLMLSTFT